MPVFLNDGSQLDTFDYKFIEKDFILNENNKKFINERVDNHGPVKCLYVGQREYATVQHTDPFIDIIGSDDATTCHIVLLVDQESKNCSLCHFDGSDVKRGIESMVGSLKRLKPEHDSSKNYLLYIVGGFLDPRNDSIKLTTKLFRYFIHSENNFYLKLALLTKLNDTLVNNVHFPIAYGLGYNLKLENVFMCNKFLEKGPDLSVRGARHFTSNENMNIYDSKNFKLIIGPFDYECIEGAEILMTFPDKFLLKNFSTSPEQEPEHFIINLKQSFKAMIDFPNPVESYFNNKTRFYEKQVDGSWKIILNL